MSSVAFKARLDMWQTHANLANIVNPQSVLIFEFVSAPMYYALLWMVSHDCVTLVNI